MKFHCLPSLVALLLPLGSLHALQPADEAAIAREISILECGISAFGAADDPFLGQAYRLRRHSRSPYGPDPRDRLRERHEEQVESCGRLHHLNAQELDIVGQFTWVQLLRRGAAWNLQEAGVDLARLDDLARTLSFEDVSRETNRPLIPRLRRLLDKAGIPRPLHATAVDYMVFRGRGAVYRQLWPRGRLGRH